ncbi:hypothetical protein [Planctobacterium marinum]|uniref:hypothetical protein n=1 Tax=Planctobacterium marinum TaxID=1631968 RepID=UPI0030C73FE3
MNHQRRGVNRHLSRLRRSGILHILVSHRFAAMLRMLSNAPGIAAPPKAPFFLW